MPTDGCTWCTGRSGGVTLYQNGDIAVVSRVEGACAGFDYTLVPQRHVASITELPPAEMGAVLAGLHRLSEGVRTAQGVEDVEIVAHPGRTASGDHVHFHVVGCGGRAVIDLAGGGQMTVIVDALSE